MGSTSSTCRCCTWPSWDTAENNRGVTASTPNLSAEESNPLPAGRAAGAHVQPCGCRQGPGAPHVPPGPGARRSHAQRQISSPAHLPAIDCLLKNSTPQVGAKRSEKLWAHVLPKVQSKQSRARHRGIAPSPTLLAGMGNVVPGGRKGLLERRKYKVGISGARIMACLCNGANLGTDPVQQQISAGESPSAGLVPVVTDKC